jgi:hypothetical protein
VTFAAAAFSSADLSFDAELHEYRLPTGQRVPSVTEVLCAVGVSTDFEGLRLGSARIRQAIDLKRDIGTALHHDAHAYDDNDLLWASVDPRVEPYLRAWATFRENTGATPLTRERRLFHPLYGYAGTLDGIFLLPTGRVVLVDLKTGDPVDSGCRFQTAAYLEAFKAEHPEQLVHERWAVRLTPDLAVPYRITPYADWQDFQRFQAFLTTYACQAERRTER